jgi:outer membrane immunogenic protein
MRYGSVRLMAGLVLVAATAYGAVTDAAAQTEFQPRPSPWEGLYLGVHAGYGWGDNDVVEDPAGLPAYNGAGNGWGYRADGAIGGVHAGLNWESNRLILGLEASFGYMAVEGDGPDPASPGLDTVAAQGDGYYGDVTARIGFAPDNKLFYMKGGMALADFGWSVVDDCTTGACSLTTINAINDDTERGWTAGAGIAFAFWQHASLRLEYAYFDFGTIRMAGTSSLGDIHSWEQDVNLHAVTAGLTFMF